MISVFLFLFFIHVQEEAPFKPKEDFLIKFDLAFKQRPHEPKPVHIEETRDEYEKRTSSTPLPYLKLLVKIIEVQPEELKVRVIRDDKTNLLTKKTSQGMEFKLDLGYTDDIKDRILGYKHVIQFLSSKKEVLSQIVIEFDKEGNYFVNGEKRGKV